MRAIRLLVALCIVVVACAVAVCAPAVARLVGGADRPGRACHAHERSPAHVVCGAPTSSDAAAGDR
jgi:hypothetical protein